MRPTSENEWQRIPGPKDEGLRTKDDEHAACCCCSGLPGSINTGDARPSAISSANDFTLDARRVGAPAPFVRRPSSSLPRKSRHKIQLVCLHFFCCCFSAFFLIVHVQQSNVHQLADWQQQQQQQHADNSLQCSRYRWCRQCDTERSQCHRFGDELATGCYSRGGSGTQQCAFRGALPGAGHAQWLPAFRHSFG